jgi:hypothetical protein
MNKKVTDGVLKKIKNQPDKQKKLTEEEIIEQEKMFNFIAVWNNFKHYPANYDLERAFGKKIASIQVEVRKYREYRAKHPELGMPEPIWRKAITGGTIMVPPSVQAQLDVFRINVDEILKATTIVVTSAQFSAELNRWVWASFKHYAKERNAVLVVLPIKYGPVKTVYQKEIGERLLTSTFPDDLKGHILFEDLLVCGGKLMLSTTRMRPTLGKFLSDRVCEMGGQVSQIIAAPKLELEHRPRVGHQYPKAIMTTGAVTIPNYHVDNLGQQDRTGELAVSSHNYAGIVIEVDGGAFHFRQLHSNKKGEFYDINPLKGGADFFTPQGVFHKPDGVNAIFCGDWHVGKTDKAVRQATFGERGIVDVLKPKEIVLQDFVDCDSVGHYEQKQAVRRAYKGPLQWDSLERELLAGEVELRWIQSRTTATINVIAANHPEHITQYIEQLLWVKDNRNLGIGARMFVDMLDDMENRKPNKIKAKPTDPVVLWFRKRFPGVNIIERQDKLLLPRNSKNPILCSMHGDIGVRGKRAGGLKEFKKMNIRIFLGHDHAAAIFETIWRVGTSTHRTAFYVTNPATNWTQTHGLIFENGQRQLMNIVKGRWYGKRWVPAPEKDSVK